MYVCMFLSIVGSEPPQLSVSEERHLAILTELPFVVPFEERVKVLYHCPNNHKKMNTAGVSIELKHNSCVFTI